MIQKLKKESLFFATTSNMFKNEEPKWKKGIGKSFYKENILMSNICPHFNKIWIANKEGTHSGDVLNFISNKNLIIPKYLFFILSSKNFNSFWNSTSKGTIMQRSDKNAMLKYKINIPSLKEQQKIIDIIEPIEKIHLNIKNQFIKNQKIYSKLMNDYKSTKINYKYTKGSLPKNEGKTPFLNVSATNKKINRYVENHPNIFKGEITLSLDGNTWLVNNNLEGFNGYLYKVWHPKLENWEIYYSLKHKKNQKIIKINETGTTIKHSARSKKEIKHISFKYKKELKILFFYELNLLELLDKIENVKNKLIDLLIK